MTGYSWKKTEKIIRLLGEIDVLHKVFSILPSLPAVEERLLRRSLMGSAVFSAKIEGIPASETQPKLETQNLLAAYQQILNQDRNTKFSLDLLRNLHARTMRNLSASAGELRMDPWAVFNSAGIAVHIAPPHFKLPELMSDYVQHIDNLYDHPVEIASAAQFIFEKIHPFADGNGRVGRLVTAFWLQKADYAFKGLLTLEKYIENHRSVYYQTLEPSHDMTEFVEFMCEAVVSQAESALSDFKNAGNQEQIPMLPRREEILSIVTDHPRCTFDFISRRFAAINPKTLHFDIAWLLKKNLIRKLGVTRGVVYEPTV
jgi:Fic family protein